MIQVCSLLIDFTIFSRQNLGSDEHGFYIPLFVPFFTLIELYCYLGLAKVAETLLNPLGDDDEDFDINYIIDRNLQVCTNSKNSEYLSQIDFTFRFSV